MYIHILTIILYYDNYILYYKPGDPQAAEGAGEPALARPVHRQSGANKPIITTITVMCVYIYIYTYIDIYTYTHNQLFSNNSFNYINL